MMLHCKDSNTHHQNNSASMSHHNLMMSVFFKLVMVSEDHRHESRGTPDDFSADPDYSDTPHPGLLVGEYVQYPKVSQGESPF